jgi:hypothetical protein
MPAVGTVLVALALAGAPLRHKGRWLLATMGPLSVALAGFATARRFPLSLALLVLGGAAATAATTLTNTLLQERVRDPLRGRVMGFYMDGGHAGCGVARGAAQRGAGRGAGRAAGVTLGAGLLFAYALALAVRTPTLHRLD